MEDKYVLRAWTNYSQPAALKALHGFVRARGIKDIRDTEKKLSKIKAFSVHKPIRRKYPTRRMILKGPRENICIDLVDFQAYSRQNGGYNWLVVALDGFTKELWVEPVKKKTTAEVAAAFEKILKRAKGKVRFTFTDMGLEFMGRTFQDLMKKHDITHYVSRTKWKSWMCERVIKTLKTLVFKYFTHEKTKRWLDIMPKLVSAYNSTPHASHGFKPGSIKASDVDEVFHRLFSRLAQTPIEKPKYQIGDRVRIAKSRLTFQKGYEQSFTDDVFKVVGYVPGSYPVPSYKLATLDDEPVSSSFVSHELGYADQNG